MTAPDVAARTAAREAAPITWPELVRRTEDGGIDGGWTWDECINCGSDKVTTRGLILEDGPNGVLRRVAWCERASCDVDRAMTEYLETPRRDGGAS